MPTIYDLIQAAEADEIEIVQTLLPEFAPEVVFDNTFEFNLLNNLKPKFNMSEKMTSLLKQETIFALLHRALITKTRDDSYNTAKALIFSCYQRIIESIFNETSDRPYITSTPKKKHPFFQYITILTACEPKKQTEQFKSYCTYLQDRLPQVKKGSREHKFILELRAEIWREPNNITNWHLPFQVSSEEELELVVRKGASEAVKQGLAKFPHTNKSKLLKEALCCGQKNIAVQLLLHVEPEAINEAMPLLLENIKNIGDEFTFMLQSKNQQFGHQGIRVQADTITKVLERSSQTICENFINELSIDELCAAFDEQALFEENGGAVNAKPSYENSVKQALTLHYLHLQLLHNIDGSDVQKDIFSVFNNLVKTLHRNSDPSTVNSTIEAHIQFLVDKTYIESNQALVKAHRLIKLMCELSQMPQDQLERRLEEYDAYLGEYDAWPRIARTESGSVSDIIACRTAHLKTSILMPQTFLNSAICGEHFQFDDEFPKLKTHQLVANSAHQLLLTAASSQSLDGSTYLKGYSPLEMACYYGTADMLQQILDRISTSRRLASHLAAKYQLTHLVCLSKNQPVEKLQRLLNHDLVGVVTKLEGAECGDYALREHNPALLRYLFEKNIANAKDFRNITLPAASSDDTKIEIEQVLIEFGYLDLENPKNLTLQLESLNISTELFTTAFTIYCRKISGQTLGTYQPFKSGKSKYRDAVNTTLEQETVFFAIYHAFYEHSDKFPQYKRNLALFTAIIQQLSKTAKPSALSVSPEDFGIKKGHVLYKQIIKLQQCSKEAIEYRLQEYIEFTDKRSQERNKDRHTPLGVTPKEHTMLREVSRATTHPTKPIAELNNVELYHRLYRFSPLLHRLEEKRLSAVEQRQVNDDGLKHNVCFMVLHHAFSIKDKDDQYNVALQIFVETIIQMLEQEHLPVQKPIKNIVECRLLSLELRAQHDFTKLLSSLCELTNEKAYPLLHDYLDFLKAKKMGDIPYTKDVKKEKALITDISKAIVASVCHAVDVNTKNPHNQSDIGGIYLRHFTDSDYTFVVPATNTFKTKDIKHEQKVFKKTQTSGYSPFAFALVFGDLHAVQQFISHGAAKVDYSLFPVSLLLVCCYSQDVEKLKLLLNSTNSADINLFTKNGMCPLHYAIINNNQAMVTLLLTSGAKIVSNPAYSTEQTTLGIACQHADLSMVTLLLEHSDEISSKRADELIVLAPSNTELNIKALSQLLRKHLANPPAEGAASSHARRQRFMLAIMAGNHNYVTQHIDLFTTHELQSMHDLTFISHGKMRLIYPSYIFGNTHSKATLKKATSPLALACRFGYVSIVTSLLMKDVDVKYKDSQGLQAIHYASIGGNLTTIKRLLKHGASINAICDYGLSALDYAVVNQQEELALYILEQTECQLSSHSLRVAASFPSEAVVNEIIGPVSNMQQLEERAASNGYRLLDIAIVSHNLPAVKLLLTKGARPSVGGSTPIRSLNLACVYGNIDIIFQVLLYCSKQHLDATTINLFYSVGEISYSGTIWDIAEQHPDQEKFSPKILAQTILRAMQHQKSTSSPSQLEISPDCCDKITELLDEPELAAFNTALKDTVASRALAVPTTPVFIPEDTTDSAEVPEVGKIADVGKVTGNPKKISKPFDVNFHPL